MLLVSAALVAAISISAQPYTQVIGFPGSAPTVSNPSGPWIADTGNPGAGADLSGNNAQHYTAVNGLGLVTSISDTNAPSEAHALLDSALSTSTISTSFDGDLWISFSAQRLSGSAWANLKLLNTNYTNTYCALGIGETTGGSTSWQYGIGQAGSAPFTNTGLIGSASPLNTGNYFVIHIAYNPLPQDDELSIWRSTSPISGIQTTAAAVVLYNMDATFDRFSIYAGQSTTFAISDIAITQIPEPSTYALLFGAATLAFAGYRRLRLHIN